MTGYEHVTNLELYTIFTTWTLTPTRMLRKKNLLFKNTSSLPLYNCDYTHACIGISMPIRQSWWNWHWSLLNTIFPVTHEKVRLVYGHRVIVEHVHLSRSWTIPGWFAAVAQWRGVAPLSSVAWISQLVIMKRPVYIMQVRRKTVCESTSWKRAECVCSQLSSQQRHNAMTSCPWDHEIWLHSPCYQVWPTKVTKIFLA